MSEPDRNLEARLEALVTAPATLDERLGTLARREETVRAQGIDTATGAPPRMRYALSRAPSEADAAATLRNFEGVEDAWWHGPPPEEAQAETVVAGVPRPAPPAERVLLYQYRLPDGKLSRPTRADPGGFNPFDPGEYAGGAVPAARMGAGALAYGLGTASGVPGAGPAAGVGASQLVDWTAEHVVDPLMGEVDTRTAPERLRDRAIDAGVEGGAMVGAGVAGAAMDRALLMRKFKPAGAGNPQILRDLEEMEVPLEGAGPLVTRSRVAQELYVAGSKLPGSEEVLRKATRETYDGISNAVRADLEAISAAETPMEAGGLLKQGLGDALETIHKRQKPLETKFEALLGGDAPVPATRAGAFLREKLRRVAAAEKSGKLTVPSDFRAILADIDANQGALPLTAFRDIRGRLVGGAVADDPLAAELYAAMSEDLLAAARAADAAKARGAAGGRAPLPRAPATPAAAPAGERMMVGGALEPIEGGAPAARNPANTEAAFLARLEQQNKTVERSMAAAPSAEPPPGTPPGEMEAAWLKTQANWREYEEGKKHFRYLLDAVPESTFRQAISGARGGATNLKQVLDTVAPEVRDAIVAVRLRELAITQRATPEGMVEVFDPVKWAREIGKMPREVRDLLMPPGTPLREATDRWTRVAGAMRGAGEVSRTSNTPTQTFYLNAFSQGRFGPLRVRAGSWLWRRVPGARRFHPLVRAESQAALMTDPKFVRWLADSQAINAADVRANATHVARLGSLVASNPALREPVQEYLRGLYVARYGQPEAKEKKELRTATF